MNIKGTGIKKILHNGFTENPSSVTINGYVQKTIKNSYNLTQTDNRIIIYFSSLRSCVNMFNSVQMESIEINIDDPISNITNMFYKCGKLEKLNINNFYLSSNFEAYQLFYSCGSLTSLDLIRISASAKKIDSMFQGCSSLTSIKNLKFDTSNVQSMNNLFYGCSKITKIEFSFSSNSLISTQGMFQGCTILSKIVFPSSFASKVTNMNNMFYGCTSLSPIDFTKLKTSNAQKMDYMFYGCNSLHYYYKFLLF